MPLPHKANSAGLSCPVVSPCDVSAKAIANLGWKEINLTAPVFAGDTLYAESEVLEVRESKKRPTQGVVTVRTRGINQNGVEVMNFIRSALIPKRGHGVGE
jgi:itaconyl-CoA hydratase